MAGNYEHRSLLQTHATCCAVGELLILRRLRLVPRATASSKTPQPLFPHSIGHQTHFPRGEYVTQNPTPERLCDEGGDALVRKGEAIRFTFSPPPILQDGIRIGARESMHKILSSIPTPSPALPAFPGSIICLRQSPICSCTTQDIAFCSRRH
jgi:hypothetical protein